MKQRQTAPPTDRAQRPAGLSRLEATLGLGALALIVVGGWSLLTRPDGPAVAASATGVAPGATRSVGLAPPTQVLGDLRPTAQPATALPTLAPTIRPPLTPVAPAPTPTRAEVASQPVVAETAERSTVSPLATPPRYLGRDPLPPGVDLTIGPFLRQLKSRGYPGVSLGDGGLGDEIRASYEAALQVQAQAFTTSDYAQIADHFAGDALASLQRAAARAPQLDQRVQHRVIYEHRVMAFLPLAYDPMGYEVVDARIETYEVLYTITPDRPPIVLRPPASQRTCYSAKMVLLEGRWKVYDLEPRHGSLKGDKCPPGWA